MRKLLITMVAGVTIFGFSAQADAKNNETFVQKGISCIQSLQQIDENKINEWINELYQKIDSKYVNKHIISNAIKNKPHIKEQIEDGTVNEEIVEEVEEEIEKEIEEENSTTVVDPTPSNPKVEQEEQSEVEQYGELTAEEAQMVQLVNAERERVGLAPLQANAELTKVARVKAQDMIDHNYFSHTSPTYGSPFDMLSQFGVQYKTAGENLAGNQSVQQAHEALMNSDGHRANILGGEYTEVGIGIVDGGPYGKMFVQLFKG